jgi:pilus assembly protein CpaE
MTVPRFTAERKNAGPGRAPAKLTALLSSRQQVDDLRQALKGLDFLDCDLQVSTLDQARPRLTNGHAPDVLLVDFGANQEATLNELDALLRTPSATFKILATGRSASVDTIRKLMRLGIVDFVPSPFNAADVRAGLNAALSKRTTSSATQNKRGKVVTFARSCGGVGATTLAIQTAAELRFRSKQEPPSVCIIDFDLQFGNVASALDLKPSVGLLQILEAPFRLDKDFLASVTTRHSSGLAIVAAPGKVVPIDSVGVETATDIVEHAVRSHDYVIIDLPRGWTNWTLGVIKASDAFVLVTDITVAGLQRCLQIYELLANQELQGVPMYLIANRHKSGWRGGHRQARDAEKVLGRKIDSFVRADPKTANEAWDRGVLLRDVATRGRIQRDVSRFVNRLMSEFQRQAAESGAPGLHHLTPSAEGGHVLQAV